MRPDLDGMRFNGGEEALKRYIGYMQKICHGELKNREDARDAFQNASLKVHRRFQRGASFEHEYQLKAYIRQSTKGAVLDLQRAKCGRRKKGSDDKKARPQQLQLKEAAFEKLVDPAGSAAILAQMFADDLLDVIRRELGETAVKIVKMKAEPQTNSQIAAELDMAIKDVNRCLSKVQELVSPHL